MIKGKYSTLQRSTTNRNSPSRRKRFMQLFQDKNNYKLSPQTQLSKYSQIDSPEYKKRKVSADIIMRQYTNKMDHAIQPKQFSPGRKSATKNIKDIANVDFKLPSIAKNPRYSHKADQLDGSSGGQIKFSYDYDVDFQAEISNLKKVQSKSLHNNKQYKFAIRTKAGCNSKIMKINQDIDVINQKLPLGLKLFCVSDGHGTNGHLVAAFIRKKLQQNLKSRLTNLKDVQQINDQIYVSMQRTNQQLLQSDINTQLSGATVVAVFIRNDKITCFNVGDSRAIMINYQNQQLRAQPLSFDQKPERPDEAKRILAAGGRIQQNVNDRNEAIGPLRVWMKQIQSPGLAMTRSFGDKAGTRAGTIPQPQITEFIISNTNKYLLVASDGVWQHLQNHQIIKHLQKQLKQDKIQEAADKLLKIASQQWDSKFNCRDDITFILVKLNSFNQLL